MSKSTHYDKGLEMEEQLSSIFHQRGVPLLVSPEILRSRGCGQIDLARIMPSGLIEVVEVKNTPRLGSTQRARIERSLSFLQSLFNSSVSLSFAFGQKDFFAKIPTFDYP